MTYKHQVFISYSSKDCKWAEQFCLRLRQDKITCFWDQDSLRAGDDWENVILNDLMDSQHILVLMSKDAKASDWVNRERMRFDAMINPQKPGVNRRLIYVLLDEDDDSFKRFQRIYDLKDANLYPGKVEDALKSPLWNKVINEIEDAVNFNPNTIAVAVAVLALTKDRFEKLYKVDWDDFAQNVNKLLKSIGIDHTDTAQFKAFVNRYGANSFDWKPFDGNEEIRQVLETVRLRVNNHIPTDGRKISWRAIGEKFYTGDNAESDQELQKISKNEPALFVIDPISLYDSQMLNKLNLLDNSFDDDKTAVLVLTPVILGYHTELMQLLKQVATNFFNRFYESKVRRRYAHCGVNICDRDGIGRLLRATVGPHVYAMPTTSSNEYTTGKGLSI
ncbi:MAG: toll/interleukin-1 receptor domain-containing protein [Acidobacteria bacterium]|nr:toll/interleukin-1 receptor domain-containing protein [Acidobacteriota bacterium]